MTMYARFTNEQVLEHLDTQAAVILRVRDMPDDERSRIGKKGGCSPAEAVFINVMAYTHLEAEAISRGLIDT